MANKTFPNFDLVETPDTGSYIVGYKADGSEEQRFTVESILSESYIPNPKVVYVSADGNNDTAEIGNPAKPFVTAQAAANAIAAGPAGSYTMRLGAGSFGGIAYTALISDRLRSILGEGPSLSFLGGITATGSNGIIGTVESGETGGVGGNGFYVSLIGDGTVNLGDVIVSGGIGGDGSVSTDGENGGSGGNGGDSGVITLEGFRAENIVANGGQGGSGGSGMNTSGNGGNGGNISEISLKRCTFNNFDQSAGAGGVGSSYGSDGAATAPMLIVWCDYNNINNPSDQTANASTYILNSIHRSSSGSAQTNNSVLVSS
jgi:hypothetical protein